MHRLEIELLGDVGFRFDGEPWRFAATPKCLPLLALLLLEERPQPRLALALALWPDEEEAVARANMRRHIHNLVRALPHINGVQWIEADAKTIVWNPRAPARSDLRDFLSSAADPSAWARAAQLYRGELLAGTFDEAIVGPRERLASQHLALLTDLASAARAGRNYQEAIGHAETILKIDEWREDVVRTLMIVRNASGDRSGALATFERFARRLRDELRSEPMFETLALRDAIRAGTLPEEAEPAPPSLSSSRALVGRSVEVDALTSQWLRAARGSGSTAFLSGEAGIGKTRLAREIQTIVETQGGRAIVGRTSLPESVPYQPIVEALRQALPFIKFEARDERWLAALLPLLPEIRRINDDLPELAQLEPNRALLRLHDAFVRAFEACARVRPLTVVFEDVHHAQPDTIDAIGALADALPSIPALLLITYRSTEVNADSPVRTLRRRLARASRAHHYSLGRLGPEDIRAIVASSNAADSDAFAAGVYALSEGNPLFAWQLVHDRTERGEEPGRAVRTVGDAIRGRLDHVSADVRAVAEVAATIGDTFTVEEIAEVGGWDESTVFAALTHLFDRQLIAERAGASFEYGFTHALIAATVYEESDATARTMRHRRAAVVLGRTRTERGGVLPLVAQHWLRANERHRARESFMAAARAALASYARGDALLYAREALALDPGAEERFEALRTIIVATDKFIDVDAAERALGEFEALAEGLGREAQYDALVTRIQFHSNHAQRAIQEEISDRLSQFVRPGDPHAWRVEALLRRVIVRMQRGQSAAGSLELGPFDYRSITEPRQRYLFHAVLAQSLFRQGKFDEGNAALAVLRADLDAQPNLYGEYLHAYSMHKGLWLIADPLDVMRSATRLVELAQARGDLLDEAAGLMDVAMVKHQLHDTAGARVDFTRALELWTRVRQPQGWANTMGNLAECEREIGHIDRAWACFEQAKARGLEAGARIGPAVSDLGLADIELLRGKPGDALARLQALPAQLEGSGEQRTLAEIDAYLGRAYCALGNYDEGLPLLARGIQDLRTIAQPRWRASFLAYYIEAMVASGRTAELRAAVNELAAIFDDDPHDQASPARICLALAAAARHSGDDPGERTWLERGREAVRARWEAFSEHEDRAAYAALPPNDLFLANDPVGLSR